MSGNADGTSMFCEQCGAHRDQFTARDATMHSCATCGKTVCPNCWNVTTDACLACTPFALAPIAAPKPARRRKPLPPRAREPRGRRLRRPFGVMTSPTRPRRG